MHKPIFILGCSKSGTSLLRNLLDGHPDLFVIPTETHFFRNTGYWVNYTYQRTKPRSMSMEEKKENLIRWISIVNEAEDSVSDSFSKGRWNVQIVKESLLNTPVESEKELMDVYMKALYQGLYNEPFPEKLRLVEKSVENAEFAQELFSFYPDVKFIHILRNPYSNLVALRKYAQYSKKTSKFPFLKLPLLSMYNSYYFLYKNVRVIPSYQIVRYEDLLTAPEKTMQEIAEFLDIPFRDSLLRPSMFSEPWQGNSTSRQKFTSISAANLDRWKTEITPLEIWAVNHFLNFVMKDFNYHTLTIQRSKYWPQKGESLKSYSQNRILLKFLSNF